MNHARFPLIFEPARRRRLICDQEVVIHCHHYNARLQSIVEDATQIDGKALFRSAAEEVFSPYLSRLLNPADDLAAKWQTAADLYAHLGYGQIELAQVEQGIITAPMSHFVEGWDAGFKPVNRPVCTFTEGYWQGAIHAITGESVHVREEACMKAGADACRFVIERNRTTPLTPQTPLPVQFTPKKQHQGRTSPHIDSEKIINSLIDMPFYGNSEGLIPAFNVYIANMPADFYTLLTARFLEQMQAKNLYSTAKKLLIFAGEICALNTLRGILYSPEWEALIAPMVKAEEDRLYGLIAVTNGLGWGQWHVLEHVPGDRLIMEALNSYEPLGHLRFKGQATSPQCFMLTGVTAGIMALLYREGTVQERTGTYYSEEKACICTGEAACHFHAEAL